jgi:hypothetical protein
MRPSGIVAPFRRRPDLKQRPAPVSGKLPNTLKGANIDVAAYAAAP